MVDGGPHGYQNGGHAHADALAITLSFKGSPLLVDAGTGCYTTDRDVRDRLRSTALHNTVVVDDQPQSRPAGPFHWATVATTRVHRWRNNEGFDYFDGEHDGYEPVVHRRHLLALHGDLVVVADLVTGPGDHDAAAHWHVHPRWSVEPRLHGALLSQGAACIEFATTDSAVETFVADTATGLGWHSPIYGRTEPATTIRVARKGSTPMWLVSVFGLNEANRIGAVECVPVWSEAGALRHSIAIRVARRLCTDFVAITEPTEGAGSAWRLLEFETDARALFCRLDEERRLTRAALVDGSLLRSGNRRSLDLALARIVPDLHLDLRGEPRIAGPAFGARLIVAGREHRLESERRSSQRA